MKPENKDKWSSWQYNVRDQYKGHAVEDIKNELQSRSLPAAVLMSQLEGDFNFSSVIRSANSFNLKAVYYFGKKAYDKRAALGTYNYIDVFFLASLDEVKQLKETYRFVALENNISKNVCPLPQYSWSTNSMIVVGEENSGIPEDVLDLCDDCVEIPSLGSVRSLNAAVASSIAMYDYFSKLQAR